MEQKLFSNSNILEWLQYYAENTTLDLEKVKIIDITRKNKNLIPTVEANNTVLVFYRSRTSGYLLSHVGCRPGRVRGLV